MSTYIDDRFEDERYYDEPEPGTEEAYDTGNYIYSEDGYEYFGLLFEELENLNEYAKDIATHDELVAYTKENESKFAEYIKGNMEQIYDFSAGTAEQYKVRLMRAFAATDVEFYEWLNCYRANPPKAKTGMPEAS